MDRETRTILIFQECLCNIKTQIRSQWMFIVPNTNFDSRSKKVGAQEKYVNGRTVIKESLLLYGNFQKSVNIWP